MTMWWIVLGALVGMLVVAAAAVRPLIRARRKLRIERARRDFRQRREQLEAKFFKLASSTGKPRGLRWADIDFDDEITLARDPHSSDLLAFVGLTVHFEAIEGGGMEEVENVRRPKAATAEFRSRRGEWQTFGRVIFNLNPSETIARENLEAIDLEPAHRS